MFISYDSKVHIKNCSFINLTSSGSGGAIEIAGNWLVTISDSIFKGNHAPSGGAIDVINTNLVVFTNNIFEDNKARPVPGWINIPFTALKGGAIMIQQEI